ncbi:MAG: hypothetical protein HYX94_13055 [Chloroflexi bacterium]|nr:hypothetical protein [Chloroflexota bacterium]
MEKTFTSQYLSALKGNVNYEVYKVQNIKLVLVKAFTIIAKAPRHVKTDKAGRQVGVRK